MNASSIAPSLSVPMTPNCFLYVRNSFEPRQMFQWYRVGDTFVLGSAPQSIQLRLASPTELHILPWDLRECAVEVNGTWLEHYPQVKLFHGDVFRVAKPAERSAPSPDKCLFLVQRGLMQAPSTAAATSTSALGTTIFFFEGVHRLTECIKEGILHVASSSRAPKINPMVMTPDCPDQLQLIQSLEWCHSALTTIDHHTKEQHLLHSRSLRHASVQVPQDIERGSLPGAFAAALHSDAAAEVLRAENRKLKALIDGHNPSGAHTAQDLLEISSLKKRLQDKDTQILVLSREVWRRDQQLEMLTESLSTDVLSLARAADRERMRAAELERRVQQRNLALNALGDKVKELSANAERSAPGSVMLRVALERYHTQQSAATSPDASMQMLLKYIQQLEAEIEVLKITQASPRYVSPPPVHNANALLEEIASLRAEGSVERVLALQDALQDALVSSNVSR